ncbi:SurA N-terminal domain-containing protein [Streptantibioticus ferralitis]|uniref:SurA N-terminal domain-containing protein n=1 Tax=Streptantibioticus ferralitis TaxID=236510 RepID=A0ABT5ZBC2_9ACTN|nr:SurA N-terminal domain-containing protein [Streptantibioticus ferralitis]MDF2260325.1 SurA N-terminal domain-containing protein [Streptantibioticus ferralitis]
MVRRRTATLSLTAAALLAATPLITSCGTEHPGAAAVIGGQTISMSALQSQVKAVRDAQGGTQQSAQLIEATSDLDRSTLNGLVFDRVLDRAAQQAGVTVTRAQVQQSRAAAEVQAGGAAALRDQLLQQYAVAPGGIDDFYRVQAEAQALAHKLGVDLATPDGQAAVTKSLVKTAQTMRVDVNPRYGTWNAQTLTLGNTTDPWLHRAVAPTPAA